MISRFERDGVALIPAVIDARECADAARRVALDDAGSGGTRSLLDQSWCRQMVSQLRANSGLAAIIGPDLVAVQCTYFEKSADRNWLVPLHQDLSIPVSAQVDHPGLSGWSRKEGIWFVRAPEAVLTQMVAVRVHLDPCGLSDGPLRVVPGSHHCGILDDAKARAQRNQRGETVCEAGQGDALVLRPLLLHASSKSSGSSKRRVLHFVFGPSALTHGLGWHCGV